MGALILLGGNPAMASENVHAFTLKTLDGKDKSLADFKGKTLLLVNVASKCGFTGQYKGLEELYRKYKDKGLVVLGFPANNFMGQEPGTDQEIQKFCSLKYDVTFPLFSKISVKGKDIHPLYAYLTAKSGHDGDIGWNFNKFLVDKDGNVRARYGSRTEPSSKELLDDLLPLLEN